MILGLGLRFVLRFFSQIVILGRVWFFFGCNFDFFVLGCSWFEILDRDYLLILPLLQNRICFVCGLWIVRFVDYLGYLLVALFVDCGHYTVRGVFGLFTVAGLLL